jgi:hypothetical protein
MELALVATVDTVPEPDEDLHESDEASNPVSIWPLLISGLGTITCGTLLSDFALKASAPWLTVSLVSLGALLCAGAIVARSHSAAVWGLGALGAGVGSLGFWRIGWDSAQVLFFVLMATAGVGTLVVLLPAAARWVVISALIVLHFGGILTAVCSAAPGTWIASTLWHFFYRPHLQFMYLNEAYHYFAPEPSPTALIWFCIHYEPDSDGRPNWRWVKIPDFDKQGHPFRPDGSRLWPRTEYMRFLGLAESTNFSEYLDNSGFPLAARQNRRLRAGELHEPPIPPYPLDDMGLELQYRPANRMSMRWTAAYVRHVARTYRHEKKLELPVKSVQVYRVIHNIANAKQIAEGWDPYDPIMHQPFYQGEYQSDGTPKNNLLADDGLPDPFLFWLIPILRENQREQEWPPTENATGPLGPPKGKLTNYVPIHAGVPDEGELP